MTSDKELKAFIVSAVAILAAYENAQTQNEIIGTILDAKLRDVATLVDAAIIMHRQGKPCREWKKASAMPPSERFA
jgi:hypothetical protein